MLSKEMIGKTPKKLSQKGENGSLMKLKIQN